MNVVKRDVKCIPLNLNVGECFDAYCNFLGTTDLFLLFLPAVADGSLRAHLPAGTAMNTLMISYPGYIHKAVINACITAGAFFLINSDTEKRNWMFLTPHFVPVQLI